MARQYGLSPDGSVRREFQIRLSITITITAKRAHGESLGLRGLRLRRMPSLMQRLHPAEAGRWGLDIPDASVSRIRHPETS